MIKESISISSDIVHLAQEQLYTLQMYAQHLLSLTIKSASMR